MNIRILTLTSAVALLSASSAWAQAAPTCNPAATTCAVSSQQMGDNEQIANAVNTTTQSNQAGVSAATNGSGDVNGTVNQDAMTNSGAATTSTGAIRGGDAAAHGNLSNIDSDNRSSAATGAINASSGASTATTGPIDASSGDSTAINGPNTLTGGNQTLTGGAQTLTGGAQTQNGTITGRTGDVDSENTVVGTNLTNSDVRGTNTSENAVVGLQGQTTEVANELSNGSNSGGNELALNATTGSQETNQANQNKAEGNETITNVDASNKSTYKSKAIFIPAVVPFNQASTIGVGNIIKETTACGPLQSVVKTAVVGQFNGLFRSGQMQQGFTYDLAPYVDSNGTEHANKEIVGADGVRRVYGHQAIIFSTIVGLASNKNIAIGGGGNEGAWGQGGMGSSSTNQQLVTNIQLKLCELGSYKIVEVPVIKEVPAKRVGQ